MESISLTQEERKALIHKMKQETKPGRRLRMHIALLAADGHSPTEIARVLYCSRTTVYATLRRFRKEGEAAFADRERETRPSPQVGGRRPPSLGGLGGGGSALGLWLGPFSLDLPHAGLGAAPRAWGQHQPGDGASHPASAGVRLASSPACPSSP
jgi:biotin operon repressor